MDEVKCNHVNEKGLTTIYKQTDNNIPDITCTKCKGKLTLEEFNKRVEYVSKCFDEGKPYV